MSFNTGVLAATDAAILDLGPALVAGCQPDVATLDSVNRLCSAIFNFAQGELPHLQLGTSFSIQLQGTLDAAGYGNWTLNFTINPPAGGEGQAQ